MSPIGRFAMEARRPVAKVARAMPPPDPPAATPPAAARGRALSARALAIGFGLALPLAWLAPWNDWYLGNAYLFNNFFPPLVVTVLLLIAAVVNPLLGARRLRRGELVVVTAILLGVGGVASSGFARYWPTLVCGPARRLLREPDRRLKLPLTPDEKRRIVARLTRDAERDFAAQDVDRDARLRADEVVDGAARIARDDRDGDGALSRDEYVAGRLANDPRAQADWRWGLPDDLFLGIPSAGPIDPNDAEFQRVVDGFLDGAPPPPTPRVEHGARVTWLDADKRRHAQLALAGDARERLPRDAVLDLESDFGRDLAGRVAGPAPIGTTRGPVVIERIEPPPRVPWSAWLPVAGAWAPLILGLILASVGIALVVRRQWLEHERLPYPVAAATLQLIDDPAPGARLPPVLASRAFRIAAGIAFAIVVWRGLFALRLVPVDVALDLDVGAVFSGQPWDRAIDYGQLVHPRIYLTIVAMGFLVTADMSFSMWFFFVAGNAVSIWARSYGYDLTWRDVHLFSFGSYGALAPLILWLGRRWYWRALLVASGVRADPLARSVAPWVWAVIAGLGAMVGWMVAHGAPVLDAIAAIVGFTGLMLVVARCLAEAGAVFVVFPVNVNELVYLTVGASLPIQAIMPLSVLGMVLTDPRESVLPYAVDVGWLAERSDAPAGRTGVAMVLSATLGAAIACAAVIWYAYAEHGNSGGYRPYNGELWRLGAQGETEPGTLARMAIDLHDGRVAFAWGAVAAGGCAVARMFLVRWPFHPLALAVSIGYAGGTVWASFLVAWLAKVAVMRYGGVGLYKRLVPAAIGLAAGESAAVCVFAVAKIVIMGLLGHPLDTYNALPG